MPFDNNHPYNVEFKPILQPGQTARLRKGEDSFEDVEVIAVWPIGVHRHDFGDLSGDSTNLDCEHLDMPAGEMAQYRYIPRDRFEVHIQHPGGVDRYRTNASTKGSATAGWMIRPYDQEGEQWDRWDDFLWMASEFIVFEDATPRFDLFPLVRTSGEINGHVDFAGIGYSLRRAKIANPPVEFWVNNRPASIHLNANRVAR